jgi:hypothetical protein
VAASIVAQKLPRPGRVPSFPQTPKSASASRPEDLLTSAREDNFRSDGKRASDRDAA